MSINHVQEQERNLIAVLKAATQALDAIGTIELASALSALEAAAGAAQKRLRHAADVARAAVGRLAGEADGVAAQLQADLSAPVEKHVHEQTPPVKQETSATPPRQPQEAPEPSERRRAVREALDALDGATKPAPEGGAVEALVNAANDDGRQEVKPDAGGPLAATKPSANGNARRGRKRDGNGP